MAKQVYYAQFIYQALVSWRILENKYPNKKYRLIDRGMKFRPVSKRYRIFKNK